jgi:hypothetical protein
MSMVKEAKLEPELILMPKINPLGREKALGRDQ